MKRNRSLDKIIKPAVFVLSLMPLSILVWNATTGNLSANPIDDITDTTGRWTLRFIMIALAVTPLRRITGWNGVIRLRRMLGLFTFFYGTLHIATYVWLDQFFGFEEIIKDVVKRPFITAGFFAFVLMIPLAITSTRGWIKRLGGKRWQLLHRLVYISAIGGVLHYLWLVKADTLFPLIYGGVLSFLLGHRLWTFLKPRLSWYREPYSAWSKDTVYMLRTSSEQLRLSRDSLQEL